MENGVLAVEGLSKSFGPVQVLFDIDLSLRRGEVHAIIGENGAGKSTLMKILSGYLPPSAGRILLDGEPVTLQGPQVGERLGIVLIHQELALAEHLNVEENIFLGREIRRGIFLDKRAMRERTREYLADLDCDIDPAATVRDLSVSDKQMVEIAKAVSREARVLIMDEPTAVLTTTEIETLFRLIRRLKEQGVTIVYISHKLDEVKELSDRVTVLRDGHLVATRDTADLTEHDMATLMVGREISDLYPEKTPPTAGEEVLRAEGVTVPGHVRDAGLTLHRGEILGLAGLVGSGRTELVEGMLGLRPRSAGQIWRNGQPLRIANPRDAAAAGIVYLTEDRKGKGVLLNMTLPPNVTLLTLEKVAPTFIDRGKEMEAYERAQREFDIRASSPDALAGNLSGGNQQKLLLARVMEVDPEIVIIDEPTRGIDIGTKQQIYHFIADLARQGRSCIVISSEMQEIIGLCHRVLIMREGRIVGEVSGAAIAEKEIVQYATGLKGAA